jgi:hypothetical protein
MRLAACVAVVIAGGCFADSWTVQKRVSARGEIRGAALARDSRLLTWGDSVTEYKADLSQSRVLARNTFGEGGCLVDLDGDGREEFVGNEGASGLGPPTRRRPPAWKPVVLEKETDTHDCVEATLFGRKGVLAIHRHAQLRFYEPPSAEGQPWSVRKIYSIYTPSHQAGLSVRDVDRDGRMDILCGNYWIQSPERPDLPWHIFAIQTWFEAPDSATPAHAMVGDQLLVAQAHISPARVALFRKGTDARQLWTEFRVAGEFHNVHAVAVSERAVVLRRG